MSRPPPTHPSAEPATRSASLDGMRARLFEVEVDRPRRIDHYIDYFGDDHARRATAPVPPGGGSWLDENGAR